MILASASPIQVWTLIVAGLAVVASVAGILVSAFLSRQSEQKVWRRDLRVRLYSDLITTGYTVLELLQQATILDKDVSEEFLKNGLNLRRRCQDVATFGSGDLLDSALQVMGTASDAAQVVSGGETPGREALRDTYANALAKFQVAVRASLDMNKD